MALPWCLVVVVVVVVSKRGLGGVCVLSHAKSYSWFSLGVPQALDLWAATGGFDTPVCICVRVTHGGGMPRIRCWQPGMCQGVCVPVWPCLTGTKGIWDNAFSVLRRTMWSSKGFPSHLLKHTTLVAYVQLTALTWNMSFVCMHEQCAVHVYLCCKIWIALPFYKVIWLRPIFSDLLQRF